MFVLAHHILHYPFGIWQLVLYGPEFIWATPVSLHFVCLIVGVTSLMGSGAITFRDHSKIARFISWIFVDVAAVVVSVLAAVYGWETQHLIQCLLCLAVILEYLFVPPLIKKVQEWLRMTVQKKDSTRLRNQGSASSFGGQYATDDVC